ncbi:MAG: 4Fe-4S binding protein [Bacillota bacterium]
MLEKTGIPSVSQIQDGTPSSERLKKGPVAVVECFQSIPCDPCRYACKQGAISEFKDINDTPIIDHELCNGCGVCISQCPGLAIFVIDATYSKKEGLVKIPYEYSPLPIKGEKVIALDREGNEACQAKVIRVQNTKIQDRTPVVWLAVPHHYLAEVRSLRREGEMENGK